MENFLIVMELQAIKETGLMIFLTELELVS